MSNLLSQPWFLWALGIVVGLPILLVALTEGHDALARRGNAMAKPVLLLRNYVLPAGALILLLTQASDVATTNTWLRIITTFFGFMLLLLVLSGLNVALFSHAQTGSWRQRLPSIFVDILRLVLIVTGLAVIFAYVWNADVAGLFTALGVTTVVLGFALQNAVGSTLSGLLLLFEQPFKLGDWLNAGGARGRVVEVNWRATHLDIGGGVQIIPNASLAGSAFSNLSRPPDLHIENVTSTFAPDDPPDQVIALLLQVAAQLPGLHPTTSPTAAMTAPKTFVTALPVSDPADGGAAASTFQRWLWYAARRAQLRLDGMADDYNTPDRVAAAVHAAGAQLQIPADSVDEIIRTATLLRFGTGETVLAPGTVPPALLVIAAGRVVQRAPAPDGALLWVTELETPEYVGQTVLTREPARSGSWALTEVTVLAIAQDAISDVVRARPELAVAMGRTIDTRRDLVQQAISRAGYLPKDTFISTAASHRAAAGTGR